MYCRNCGSKLENDNQVKCENCGFVEENFTSIIDNDNFFGKEEKVEESVQDVQGKCVCECKSDPVNVKAIIGFCCSFSFAIIGLIFSILGMKYANKNNGLGKKYAVAGMVISIVVLSIGFIEFVVSCSLGFMMGLESALYSPSV